MSPCFLVLVPWGWGSLPPASPRHCCCDPTFRTFLSVLRKHICAQLYTGVAKAHVTQPSWSSGPQWPRAACSVQSLFLPQASAPIPDCNQASSGHSVVSCLRSASERVKPFLNSKAKMHELRRCPESAIFGSLEKGQPGGQGSHTVPMCDMSPRHLQASPLRGCRAGGWKVLRKLDLSSLRIMVQSVPLNHSFHSLSVVTGPAGTELKATYCVHGL